MNLKSPVWRLASSFVLCAGSCVAVAQTLPGLPFTETFQFDNLKDIPKTTGDWNIGAQKLRLSGSGASAKALTGTTFDTTSVEEVLTDAFYSRGIVTGDMNGDGYPDLVEATRDGGNHVYLNDGTGHFTLSYSTPELENTRAVAVGDIDRDGDLDFVAANFNGPTRVYLNDGTGLHYVMQLVTAQRQRSDGVALADLNSDGFLDVVLANEGAGAGEANLLVLNTHSPTQPFGPNGSSGVELDPAITEVTHGVVVGDVDNDGDNDIVFLNGTSGQVNRVHLHVPAGSCSPPSAVCFAHSVIGTGADIQASYGGALGDMNGDGLLDLVVANFGDTDDSKIYYNQNNGPDVNPFTAPGVTFKAAQVSTFSSDVALADIDNDGDLDIVLVDAGHPNRSRIYFNDYNNGTGDGIPPFPVIQIGPDVQRVETGVAVADFDGDNDLDLVFSQLETQPDGPKENAFFRNTGVANGALALQLRGQAVSLGVDNNEVPAFNAVKLTAHTSAVGPALHNYVDFWVSSDGGVHWVTIGLDGRPVAIPFAGQDLRWRAVLRSDSPFNASTLSVDDLTVKLNSLPVVGTPIGAKSINEQDAVTNLPIVPHFTDADGDTLYYSVTGLPVGTGLSINPDTGALTGAATNADTLASPISVTVWATDGATPVADTFQLTVVNANNAPSFTSFPPNVVPGTPPTSPAAVGVAWVYNIATTDPDPAPDNQRTITAAAPLPAWLTLIDHLDGTAVLSGTPTGANVGTHAVALTVTDVHGAFETLGFQIIVTNTPPVITSFAGTAAPQGALYTYNITTTDADPNDTRALSATTLPSWLALTDHGDGTGVLSGTPGNANVGTGGNAVVLVVKDLAGASATESFTISVSNTNDAPSFTSTPVLVAAQGAPYVYQVATADPDVADTRAITATQIAGWLVLTDHGNGTATLSGTPGSLDVGGNAIKLRVADAGGLSVIQSFTIVVANINDAPTITSAPLSAATQGVAYAYHVTSSDPDLVFGDTLRVTSTSLPAWLHLTDSGTGDGKATLAGTPGSANVGANLVGLVVTDSAGATATQSFTITVANSNDAPSFTSAAVTAATEGSSYEYAVTASDPDASDVLTISATLLPTWLTLTDHGDGTATLRGQPAQTEIGDNAVTLVVTDATKLTATQSFTIKVANVEHSPVFTSRPWTDVTEGQKYDYLIVATDADGGALNLTTGTLPAWLALTNHGDGTGELVGTPKGANVGSYAVQLTADDGSGTPVATQMFNIVVTAAADGPVVTINGSTPVNVSVGEPYSDALATAKDPQDGDLTSKITVDNPVNVGVAGSYTITYTVTDTAGHAGQAQRTVIVAAKPSSGGGGGSGGGGSIGLVDLIGLLGIAAVAGWRRRTLRIDAPLGA